MNKLIDAWGMNAEVQWVIFIILCILVFSSTAWYILGKIKPSKLATELQVRTRSWWIMCVCFILSTVVHPVITHLGLAFLSYALLREMYPLLKLDLRERNVVLLCYAVVPVQYALAYYGKTEIFLAFIPVFMFVIIPFVLVTPGETQGLVRSISLLPYSLVAWVYGMSHLALLFQMPEIPGFTAGPEGLLLYLIFLVGMNDVLQFAWGKTLGKHPVLPRVSPNKTWEGLIGGVLIHDAPGNRLALSDSIGNVGSGVHGVLCRGRRIYGRCDCLGHQAGRWSEEFGQRHPGSRRILGSFGRFFRGGSALFSFDLLFQ